MLHAKQLRDRPSRGDGTDEPEPPIKDPGIRKGPKKDPPVDEDHHKDPPTGEPPRQDPPVDPYEDGPVMEV